MQWAPLFVLCVLCLQVSCAGSGGGSAQPPGNPPGTNPPPVTEFVVIVGQTTSSNFPVTGGAFQAGNRGNTDGTVTLIQLSSPPRVVFSTYFGGSNLDQVRDAFIDGEGNIYIIGRTSSPDITTTAGAFQRNYGGGSQDGFLAKFSPTGQLLFSTYLGGSSQDNGYSIFVDAAGFIYIGGRTSSPNFPATPGAFQTTYGGGTSGTPFFGGDMFVAKMRPDASGIVWATYIGGAGDDVMRGRIAVDSAGNVYGQGRTESQNFPLMNPVQNTLRGSTDSAFIKLSADGTRLIYSTYFGGLETTFENGQGGVALNAAGDAYFCGYTTASSGFPLTAGAFQTTLNGNENAYLARFSSTGTLMSSTLLGGSGFVECMGLDLDSAGNPIVLSTAGPNFPTTSGSFQTVAPGAGDLAVTKFRPDLAAFSGLVFSTYVGGTGEDIGDTLRVQVDSSNNIYLAGSSASSSFPVTAGAIQSTYSGGAHDLLFVILSSDGSRLLYATFFGGGGDDFARSIRYRRL
jgi:hypothetical protein